MIHAAQIITGAHVPFCSGLTPRVPFGISDGMRIAHILMLAFAAGCIPAQATNVTWDNNTGNSCWDVGTSYNWYKEEYVDYQFVKHHMTFTPNDHVYFTGEGAEQVVLGQRETTADEMTVYGNADYTITGGEDNSQLSLLTLSKDGAGTLTIANTDLTLRGGINYALQLKEGTLDIAETVGNFNVGEGRLVDLQGGTLLLHGREVNADMEYDFKVNGEVRLDAATIHRLQGSGTLVKISDGTLTLRDACRVNNIRLEQGTLRIGDEMVLKDPHTNLELQGGALDLAGFEFEGDLSLLYGCTTTINSGIISGLISGSGGLTKVGDGTLVVGYQKYADNYNRYYGGTVVNGGILKAAADYAFGDTRQFITVNAGELDLGGHLLLNPVLAKNDTTLHASGAIMGTLAPDACRIDIDGTLSAINVMMQNEVIPTGMDDLQGGGEIRVKKGDTLYLVKEVEVDELEHRSEFHETASVQACGEAEHAVLHNVNLFVDTRVWNAALILGASREKSYVDHLDFRSETGIMLRNLTVGSDCSFTAGNPDAITLWEVTIDLSDSFQQLSATEYYFDLTGLFHCDLDMQDVYLDATDLNLNLADATVKLDFGEQVNITGADGLRLGMKGYDTELTTAQDGTLTFKATVQTPEPATGTLSLLALAALAARRRR